MATATTTTPSPANRTDEPVVSTVRPKLDERDEVDPFSDANSVQRHQAVALLRKAGEVFLLKHYSEAAKLYAEAERTDRTALTPADREQWGYGILSEVVETLNRSEGAVPADLDKQVRVALSLAPKLDTIGQDLLRKIQDRQTTPVAAVVDVKHVARQAGQSYAIAETTNFRVFHNQAPEYAEKVLRAAEAARLAAARKWFGDDGGRWEPRCELYLHASGTDYARATGVPATSPGHSTMRSEGERVLSRRIDLHCDDPNMFIGVLPHETTHVVLAGRFGRHPVPRWADEGMAVLSEPRDRIERHLRNLPQHSRDGLLFVSGDLVRLNDYPEPRQIGAFYAQSVSLVDYLSSRKGPQVFAKFLRDGLDGGYEAALKKHYGINDFRELDAQWRQYAFGGGNSTVVGKMR
jgi:hypothetical protein